MKKRQAKKNRKRQEERILQQKGYSRKQQKKLEKSVKEDILKKEKRKQQKARANKRYNEKRKKLAKDLGLTGYSKYSLKQLLSIKEQREKQNKQEEKKRKKQTNKKKRVTGKVFIYPTYLYVGFYDKAGEIDIIEYQHSFEHMTTSEIGRMIMETYQYYLEDGSSGRAGNIIIDTEVESPKWFMLIEGNRNEQKGYQTIMVNQFTVRGALILLCSLLENCREDARDWISQKLEFYFKKVPQLYKYMGEYIDWDTITGRKWI